MRIPWELRYVLLHTFAHALCTSSHLHAATPPPACANASLPRGPSRVGSCTTGILLYTAASDREGTLGDPVNPGNEPGSHLCAALEAMHYCASDPLCAEHIAFTDHILHGASCHACLFARETSCERGNRYLDRPVLIGTVETGTLAFFADVSGQNTQGTFGLERSLQMQDSL
jgi:hypothetical protein